MLGDTASRCIRTTSATRHLIGKHVILPLVGRRIPIVADDYSDPEKGSGAVKITPAHDFNDFEVGKRHGLPQINVLDRRASSPRRQRGLSICAALPEGAAALSFAKNCTRPRPLRRAQAQIVARLEDSASSRKIEPHTHMVPHGDRSGVVIEPYLTDQWYVDAKTWRSRRSRRCATAHQFRAEELGKDLFRMDGEHPALVHLAPALVGPSDPGLVRAGRQGVRRRDRGRGRRQRARLLRRAGRHHAEQAREMALELRSAIHHARRGRARHLVLLGAVAVLDARLAGRDAGARSAIIPTNVLVTGFDIIFFWVARMMMMGLHFMKEVPFRDRLHPRAGARREGRQDVEVEGQRHRSPGVIDEYGADALRFTLARMAAQGRDIKLSPQRVEGYRNFATKLWNACRFAEMNGCVTPAGFDPTAAKETLNRWIAHETARATREVTEAIEAYRFNDAANAIYRFVWNVYCDWYAKPNGRRRPMPTIGPPTRSIG
jgi:valyl-tRNA synthetase